MFRLLDDKREVVVKPARGTCRTDDVPARPLESPGRPHDEASEEAAQQPQPDGRGHGGQLGGGLAQPSPALGHGREEVGPVRAVVLLAQSEGVESAGQASQCAGQGVERVDTAGVVDPQLVGEQVGQEEETAGGDDSPQEAEDDGDVGLQENISHSSYWDPPSQHRVLDVIDVEFPLGVGERRHDEGGEDGGEDGGVGVHHGALLWSAWLSPAGHEAGPEDPEEESPQQREDIGGPGGRHLLTASHVVHVQGSAHSEPEEGCEHVEKYRVANIESEVKWSADELVERVENNLEIIIIILMTTN